MSNFINGKDRSNTGYPAAIPDVDEVGGTLSVGRFFQASDSGLTIPSTTATGYSANDAVSNNSNNAVVSGQSFSVADLNNEPVTLERVRVSTSDTGPGTAGATFEAWMFNAAPTATGGDNAAFGAKRAGFIGRMSGTFVSAQDGSVAVLTPTDGSRIITNPATGAKVVYALFKTLTAYTPGSNNAVYNSTVEGFQGRA